MKSVHVRASAPHPFQIDGFPQGAERSVSDGGALHFTPGGVKEITDAEWSHIALRHKHHAAHMEVTDIAPPPAPPSPEAA